MSKSKDRGTRFEREVVEYLKANGFPHARRLALQGTHDVGDVTAGDAYPVVIECKDQAKHEFSLWLKETGIEVENALAEFGFTVAKRRGYNVKDAYLFCTLAQLPDLLERIYGKTDGQGEGNAA